MNDFNDRASYITWRSDWRAKWRELTVKIRALKLDRKQRARDGKYAKEIEAIRNLRQLQHEATAELEIRRLSKVKAGQYRKESDHARQA
jgi:hypothetical protein